MRSEDYRPRESYMRVALLTRDLYNQAHNAGLLEFAELLKSIVHSCQNAGLYPDLFANNDTVEGEDIVGKVERLLISQRKDRGITLAEEINMYYPEIKDGMSLITQTCIRTLQENGAGDLPDDTRLRSGYGMSVELQAVRKNLSYLENAALARSINAIERHFSKGTGVHVTVGDLRRKLSVADLEAMSSIGKNGIAILAFGFEKSKEQ